MRPAALLAVAALSVSGNAPTPQYTEDGQLVLPERYREWVFLSSGMGMTYGPLGTGRRFPRDVRQRLREPGSVPELPRHRALARQDRLRPRGPLRGEPRFDQQGRPLPDGRLRRRGPGAGRGPLREEVGLLRLRYPGRPALPERAPDRPRGRMPRLPHRERRRGRDLLSSTRRSSRWRRRRAPSARTSSRSRLRRPASTT